ncbi:hypothetical protein A2982_03470 [candidate division WWE3 bacterium RIFCSPLOWO2_01_FULL_39_13]|uniref:DinB-like domain-containing protein n=1 Tax=candidate division WWE3 bacterium RIFCSPLOWO2_01_FULL_39_13 TaxID=1802624 RepID=A0A1F4V579_UNCKA|nr:MAG: hypothetical protein A2982_03470 [candidate division WWE3 bacterium RIFCSPLOWO2_01_FULL_39_13]
MTDPGALAFWTAYLRSWGINRDFFELIPEDKYDFRMVDSLETKSDTPRESVAHQISVQRSYLDGAQAGEIKFGSISVKTLAFKEMSKEKLLKELANANRELFTFLCDPEINKKVTRVPWSRNPVGVTVALWSLNSHEILHTGWNLALMDHLRIKRYPSLIAMWG